MPELLLTGEMNAQARSIPKRPYTYRWLFLAAPTEQRYPFSASSGVYYNSIAKPDWVARLTHNSPPIARMAASERWRAVAFSTEEIPQYFPNLCRIRKQPSIPL
jgi:hypothetical protein